MATFDNLPLEIQSIIFNKRYDIMKYELQLKKYKKSYNTTLLEMKDAFECYQYQENYLDLENGEGKNILHFVHVLNP